MAAPCIGAIPLIKQGSSYTVLLLHLSITCRRLCSRHRFLANNSSCGVQARVLQCLRDIACGANYLHAAGVLHGDLKPANVLLQSRGFASSPHAHPHGHGSGKEQAMAAERLPSSTAGSGITCKLADFGLSRVLSADASHLTTHSFGTVTHMPPELLRDGIFSRAADVYSFAMISKCPWPCCHEAPCSMHLLACNAPTTMLRGSGLQ